METASVLADLLERSGLSKSALCTRAHISRALFDDYLKGRTQPSVPQVERLARAAGFKLDLALSPLPRPLPPAFVAVLEFGDLFPRKEKPPPVNLGPLWRQIERRRIDG